MTTDHLGTMTAAAGFDPAGVLCGPRDGRQRLLHTMLRVADMDRALHFYVDGLGMAVQERIDLPGLRARPVFIGFDGDDPGAPIELVAYADHRDPYTHGTGFGHVAVGVSDVAAIYQRMLARGAAAVMAPCVLADGGPLCAFIGDADGYAVELAEAGPCGAAAVEPWRTILGPDDGQRRLLHTMLRIADIDASLRFYVDGLGMTLLHQLSIEARGGVTASFVGYPNDEAGRMLELAWFAAASDPYTHGSGFGHVAAAVPDVVVATARLAAMGYVVAEPPAVLLPGAPGRSFVCDPDGYRVELVQTGGAR